MHCFYCLGVSSIVCSLQERYVCQAYIHIHLPRINLYKFLSACSEKVCVEKNFISCTRERFTYVHISLRSHLCKNLIRAEGGYLQKCVDCGRGKCHQLNITTSNMNFYSYLNLHLDSIVQAKICSK